jgi:hypothetical protein
VCGAQVRELPRTSQHQPEAFLPAGQTACGWFACGWSNHMWLVIACGWSNRLRLVKTLSRPLAHREQGTHAPVVADLHMRADPDRSSSSDYLPSTIDYFMTVFHSSDRPSQSLPGLFKVQAILQRFASEAIGTMHTRPPTSSSRAPHFCWSASTVPACSACLDTNNRHQQLLGAQVQPGILSKFID